MIFHISAAVHFGSAGKFIKQITGFLAENIDQYIQSAAMSHADQYLENSLIAGALNQLIEHWNQTFTTFEAKAFGSWPVTGQMLFKALCRNQLLQ